MWLTSILKLCVDWWRELLILSLCVALSLMTSHFRTLTAERDAKTQEIQFMRDAAEQYQTRSQNIAKEISDAHRDAVLATEKNAFENAKRKFAGKVVACPVRSIGTVGVLPKAVNGDGQAGSSEGTDGVQIEESLAVSRAFVEDCALDASVTQSWGRWAVKNDLPISKE